MAIIKLNTLIAAPPEVCFDLARSVDVHLSSTQQHNETVIAGSASGLMQLNHTVTWRARHFGLNWQMQVGITELQSPDFFADRMLAGPFRLMRHYHYFKLKGNTTCMTDEFVFRSPFGWLGSIVDVLILKPYLTRLLKCRNATIKYLAENSTNTILHEPLNHTLEQHQPAA